MLHAPCSMLNAKLRGTDLVGLRGEISLNHESKRPQGLVDQTQPMTSPRLTPRSSAVY